MKRRGLVIILALAMSFPVAAAEKQSEQSLGRQQQTYTPSLAVVMGLIQLKAPRTIAGFGDSALAERTSAGLVPR